MSDKKAPDPTRDRVGVNAIEAIVLKEFGWLFREQAISDYGIDAHIEEVDSDNKATGKLVALQIKSGTSYFKKRGADYVFYGEPRHLNYWTNHSLAVFIILHNPETGQVLWQKVHRSLIEETDKAWLLTIPSGNVFDKTAKQYFAQQVAATPEARRRLLMASRSNRSYLSHTNALLGDADVDRLIVNACDIKLGQIRGIVGTMAPTVDRVLVH